MHGPVPLLRPAACAARAIDGWMPQDDDAGGRQDHRPRRVPSDWIICMDWIPIPPIVNMTDDVKAHRHAGRPATHGARRQGRGSTTTNTSPLPPRPRRRRRRRPERDHGINDELLPVACSVATGNPLLHTRASYPGAARRGVAWPAGLQCGHMRAPDASPSRNNTRGAGGIMDRCWMPVI